MRKLSYNGVVNNDIVKLWEGDLMRQDLLKYYNGKRFTITISEYKKPMSSKQHRYYRGCMLPEVQFAYKEAGWKFTLGQVDEILHKNFMTEEIANEDTGEIMVVPLSMADVGTVQFNEMKENIQQWCSEYLCHDIPDPNQQKKIDL